MSYTFLSYFSFVVVLFFTLYSIDSIDSLAIVYIPPSSLLVHYQFIPDGEIIPTLDPTRKFVKVVLAKQHTEVDFFLSFVIQSTAPQNATVRPGGTALM